MMLARIRTDALHEATHVAAELRARGYRVEIVSPTATPTAPAQLEINLHCMPINEALAEARRLADSSGCDLLIASGAPGAVEEPISTAAEPELDSAVAAPVICSEPEPVAIDLTPESKEPLVLLAQQEPERIEETVKVAPAQQELPPPASEQQEPAEPAGPDWMQLVLDRGAVLFAQLQSALEQSPDLARRASSRCSVVFIRGGAWLGKNLKLGGKGLGKVAGAASVHARQRWRQAREQYATVRAAGVARAQKMREQRRQVKLESSRRAPVEVLETTAPAQRSASGGWRAALAGALIAALVIGVGFSLGARKPPAAAHVSTQQNAPAAIVNVAAPAVRASKTAPAKRATRASNPDSRRAVQQSDNADDQEVIVRHFAPVKSTPSVTADGVHHYSDTDQR